MLLLPLMLLLGALPELPKVLSRQECVSRAPALAPALDGGAWVAWIEFRAPGGECVVAARIDAQGKPGGRETLCEPGEVFAPSVAVVDDGTAWVAWGQREGDKVALVLRRRGAANWEPVQPPAAKGRVQWQPVLVPAQGKGVELVWLEEQERVSWLRRARHDGEGFGPVEDLTPATGAAAFPAAARASDGALWIAWSELESAVPPLQQPLAKLYELRLARHAQGATGASMLLSRQLPGHGLHASLAAGRDGGVWIAWDQVTVPRQNDSRITSVQRRGDPSLEVSASVRLARASPDGNLRHFDANLAPAIPAGLGSHGAFPVVACDKEGMPMVAFRAPRFLPVDRGVAWDVALRRLDGREARIVPESDGPLERVALARGQDGRWWSAWQCDRRRSVLGMLRVDPERAKALGVSEHFLAALGTGGEVLFAREDSAPPAAVPAESLLAPEVRATAPEPAKTATPSAATANASAPRRVLWADLHTHSSLSRCSLGRDPHPELVLRYARDLGGCDVFALTDHVEQTSDAAWHERQALMDAFHAPGAFVTLFGYEWTHGKGHKNLVQPGRLPLRHRLDPALDSPEALFAALGEGPVLTIPHHSADKQLPIELVPGDGRHQRLMEIFQGSRGSFEEKGEPRAPAQFTEGRFVRDALRAGWRVGFSGSSDHGFGRGYTGILDAELTRESVFEALAARRCFASSVHGLVLELTCEGRPMGSELELARAPSFQVRVEPVAPLARVELISAEGTVATLKLDEQGRLAESSWTAPDFAGTRWHYLRAIQRDGEMAWSSPIWVTRIP